MSVIPHGEVPVNHIGKVVLDVVEPRLSELVLSPTARPTDRERAAYRQLLEAVEVLVGTTKPPQSARYAMKDAGLEPQALSAKHCLDILDRLHGPQPGYEVAT